MPVSLPTIKESYENVEVVDGHRFSSLSNLRQHVKKNTLGKTLKPWNNYFMTKFIKHWEAKHVEGDFRCDVKGVRNKDSFIDGGIQLLFFSKRT